MKGVKIAFISVINMVLQCMYGVETTVPVFSDVAVPINVPEGTLTETLLDTFNVNDPDNQTITSCSHTGDSGEFDIRQDVGDSTVFTLYLVSGAVLDYSVNPSYSLSVTCTDADTDQTTYIITIDIIPNQPPILTSPPSSVSVKENTVVQTLLYTLTVSDVESDAVSCDMMSVTPSTSVFDVLKPSTDFEVYILANPNLQYSVTSSYIATLRCSDAYGSTTAALTIDVIPKSVPVFSDVAVPINLPEGTLTETLLDTFNVNDPDNQTITSCSHTGDSGEFDIRQDVGDATVFTLYLVSGAGLDYSVNPSYSLSVTCTDADTDQTTHIITLSNILNIDIIPNQPPILTSPPSSVSVKENTVVQTLLYTLTVSDVESDAVSCDMMSVTPSTSVFDVLKPSTDFEVYIIDNPNLQYSVTSSYIATLRCFDAYGSTTAALTIDVIPNAGPTFENLPRTKDFKASSTNAGTVLRSVTTSDVDSSTVTYSIDVSPATDVFTINQGTGVVTAARDLIYALYDSYDITVFANDGKTTTSENLRIILRGINTAPTISNLPATEVISELATSGTILYLSIEDPNSGDTVSVTSWTVSPSSDSSKFTYNDTNRRLDLASGQSLDYEAQANYVLLFYVSDQKAETGPHTLIIEVDDRNEPCTFDKPVYHATTYESGTGSGAVDFGAVISDPDNGDTYTLSLMSSGTEHSSFFNVDATSPILTFAVNYDVDSNVYPSNVTLVIVCTDSGGETGTATVSVTVNEVNDNAPDFTNTGIIVYSYPTSTIGGTLTSLSATDEDSGSNARLKYSWTSASSSGIKYYQLSAQGTISLVGDISGLSYGQSYRFIVTAKDHGNPILSGTTTVDIIYIEATTTTTTTTPTTATASATTSMTFFDEPGNVAIVVCMSVLGVALLGLTSYLLHRYCKCQKFCRKTRKPTTKVKEMPKKPNAEKEQFDFWNDGKHPNNDMLVTYKHGRVNLTRVNVT